jgi:alanine racemase
MSSIKSYLEISTIGHRPTWAEIDLDALAANLQTVRQLVGPDINIMAVVKSDAYGHGAVACARRLASEGATWFGVATPEEGIELREGGIEQPILSLGGFWKGQDAACVQQQLTAVVYRVEMVEALNLAALDAGVIADVHVKIDTGMGRLGVRFDQVKEFAEALKRFKNVRVDGLMTHLAAADDRSCQSLTLSQIQRFEAAAAVFRELGYNPGYRHLANSAAVFDLPSTWGNMVRPGGVLYGLWRDVLQPLSRAAELGIGNVTDRIDRFADEPAGNELEPNLKPVMSLRSRITMLKWVPAGETVGYGCTYEASRNTLVATLPIGYNDGYPRSLSNRGRALVRGTLASVIGRVSMDMTLVDVTTIADVKLGDVVTLMGQGTDNAKLSIPAEDLAKTAGTISYEITCGISHRVPRIYLPE